MNKAEIETSQRDQCPQSYKCGAGLCPLVGPAILQDRYWYPDEPISRGKMLRWFSLPYISQATSIFRETGAKNASGLTKSS